MIIVFLHITILCILSVINICTFVILISAIVALTTGLSLDGYFGLAGALLVMFSAVKLIKDTINPLLGVAPDKELITRIGQKLKSYPEVLDYHDLIVHTYGPTKTFATVHVEVDSNVDIMISHDMIDNIERDFKEQLGLLLTIHMDPIVTDDENINELKRFLLETMKENITLPLFPASTAACGYLTFENSQL